jgi:hypothetical protein
MSQDEAISQALSHAGLDEGSRALVAVLLHQSDDGWRACCGSNCKPCSTQLAVAVDHARALLTSAHPGAR